jgi:hypothetical protein
VVSTWAGMASRPGAWKCTRRQATALPSSKSHVLKILLWG